MINPVRWKGVRCYSTYTITCESCTNHKFQSLQNKKKVNHSMMGLRKIEDEERNGKEGKTNISCMTFIHKIFHLKTRETKKISNWLWTILLIDISNKRKNQIIKISGPWIARNNLIRIIKNWTSIGKINWRNLLNNKTEKYMRHRSFHQLEQKIIYPNKQKKDPVGEVGGGNNICHKVRFSHPDSVK